MSTMRVPQTHMGRWHTNSWLVAVIALAAMLVGLGAWVIVDRTSSASPGRTEALAAPEVVGMLKDRMAALNAGNATALASFYTDNAVLDERVTPPVITKGNEQIGSVIAGYVNAFGMHLQSTGPIIQVGRTVSEATIVPGDPTSGFILVYNLAPNGKIAYQWVLPTE